MVCFVTIKFPLAFFDYLLELIETTCIFNLQAYCASIICPIYLSIDMEIDNLETPGPNDVQKKRSRKDSEGIESVRIY